MFEKSVELDFSPLVGAEEGGERGERILQRCRKLEMLGECCQRGEEKV